MNRRFTILIHDFPFLHWDLLVEDGETLRTWRLHEEPDQSLKIVCEPLPDHRLIYLDYEGPVSRDRGNVQQWTTGRCELSVPAEGRIELELSSPRLTGKMSIRQENDGRWCCYPPGAELPPASAEGAASD
ncbi:hypothetical protein Pla110_02080 [Polystyrenella longa]|uniref:DNA ligase D 3'-phosphoesterase domain-containing protein n=1 Tax=Polystyrenella longa TaxID=2528007 RepID=A0A518CH57_9PLAN|nr:DNA polymerase ligase N-terminal domain-containing protein [Polystyrenella longa]QDU78504.1 hypothetical protein Pla110_02080 [Polystyrenella longa]